MDAYLGQVRENIARFGWVIQGVLDDPPWIYTVGLTARKQPELLLSLGDGRPTALGGTGGLPSLAPLDNGGKLRAGQKLLNLLGAHIVEVGPLGTGIDYRPVAGSDVAVRLIAAPVPLGHMNVAKAMYGPTVRVLTVVPGGG